MAVSYLLEYLVAVCIQCVKRFEIVAPNSTFPCGKASG